MYTFTDTASVLYFTHTIKAIPILLASSTIQTWIWMTRVFIASSTTSTLIYNEGEGEGEVAVFSAKH